MLNFKDENERMVARGPVSKHALGLENFPKSLKTSGIRKHFDYNRPQGMHEDDEAEYRMIMRSYSYLAGKLREIVARRSGDGSE